MNEAKLILFPSSLEYRFGQPGWRAARTPVPLDQLLAQARGIDAERCQRLVLSGGSPLEHPQFTALATQCRQLGFKRMAIETDAKQLARPGVVAALGRLGFEQLVIVMGGLRESVHDAVTHEPGTLRVSLEGLKQGDKVVLPS